MVNDTREDVKREFCRGQTPEMIDPEQYDTAPDWVKRYIVGNGAQWLAAGCARDS